MPTGCAGRWPFLSFPAAVNSKECFGVVSVVPQEMSAMLDLAKIADLVLRLEGKHDSWNRGESFNKGVDRDRLR